MIGLLGRSEPEAEARGWLEDLRFRFGLRLPHGFLIRGRLTFGVHPVSSAEPHVMPTPRLAARLVGLGLFAAALGCGQSSSSPPPAKTPPAAAVASTDGKGLFTQHCSNCHAAGDVPRKGKGKGPDLSHVASEADHTPAWIGEHIRDPKIHEPSSKMPAFGSKLKPEEIKSIVDYLSTLK
jgi:mono/diheme cytochrome c family protein